MDHHCSVGICILNYSIWNTNFKKFGIQMVGMQIPTVYSAYASIIHAITKYSGDLITGLVKYSNG